MIPAPVPEGCICGVWNDPGKEEAMAVILVSQSPRRRELMKLFHIPFAVCSADVDETMDPAQSPCDEVARVSRVKATAVERTDDDVVIAADTIVVCGGRVLGKPHSPAEAVEMLTLLSGREHEVMTGVTVLHGDQAETVTEVTQIRFRELTPGEIRAYVDSGEPMDKAGAYGIQGGAALFAAGMVGDYYNVMGLPVCRLWQILCKIAPELLEERI